MLKRGCSIFLRVSRSHVSSFNRHATFTRVLLQSSRATFNQGKTCFSTQSDKDEQEVLGLSTQHAIMQEEQRNLQATLSAQAEDEQLSYKIRELRTQHSIMQEEQRNLQATLSAQSGLFGYFRRKSLERDIATLGQRLADVQQQIIAAQQEKAAIWEQISAIKKEKAAIEQRKAAIEQEKTAIEQRKAAIEQEKTAIEQRKQIEENQHLEMEELSKIPTVEELKQMDLVIPEGKKGKILRPPANKIWYLSQEGATPLFVRECYLKLFEICKKCTRNGIVLSGNPGIGKSWSLIYFMIKFLQEGYDVVFHNHGTDTAYIFFANGNRHVLFDPFKQLRHYLQQKNTIYLFNPFGESPREPIESPKAFTIVAPSPNPAHYKQFYKLNGELRYIPVWSYEELFELNSEWGINGVPLPEETLQDRFGYCGGIPRFIFSDTNDMYDQRRASIKNAIFNSTFEKFQSYFTSQELPPSEQKSGELSHKLICQLVTEEFRPAGLSYNSEQIKMEVFKKFANAEAQRTVELIHNYLQNPLGLKMAAELFDGLVKQVLHARPKEEWENDELFQSTWKFVSKNDPISEGSLIFVAKPNLPIKWSNMNPGEFIVPLISNFPLGDVIYRTKADKLVIFNATVAASHSIKLKSFMKKLEDYPWVESIPKIKKPTTQENSDEESCEQPDSMQPDQELLQAQNNVHVVWVFPNEYYAKHKFTQGLSNSEHKCNLRIYNNNQVPEWLLNALKKVKYE